MDKEIIIELENWLSERIEPLAEDLAKKIAPMANHMTILTEHTKMALEQTQKEFKHQCKEMNEQMNSMVQDWELRKQTMVEEWESVTQDMKQQAQETMKATRAFQKMKWAKLLIVALIISVVSPITYGLWQSHYSKKAKETAEQAQNWNLFMDRFIQLNKKQQQTVKETLGIKWE